MPYGVSSKPHSELADAMDLCIRYLWKRPYPLNGVQGENPICKDCHIANKKYIVRASAHGCPFILEDMEKDFYETNPELIPKYSEVKWR